MTELADGVADLPSLVRCYALTPPVEVAALPQRGMNNQSVGVHTGAGDFIWKSYTAYDDPASIHYEHHLLTWLATAGLSFAMPVPTPARDGTLLSSGARGGAALAPWLPGVRLDPGDPDQIDLLGGAAGELLATLRRYPLTPRPGRCLFQDMFHFPVPPLDACALRPEHLGLPAMSPHDGLLGWWREEAERLRAFVAGPYRTLPWQVCHNDVTPANMLVQAGRVSAVLDFEFAAPAARALDLAMGLRMAMRVWETPEPWEAVRRFCRGYTRWLPITAAEARAVPWLIRLRGAISVFWWLGRPGTAGDTHLVLERITYLRNVVRWLDRYERTFVETIMQETG